MDMVSVNVGTPRLLAWMGSTFPTGIFKEPVAGPVMLRHLNLDGDRQADLSVHGGEDKAVYGYPAEHYDFWRRELGVENLPWGSFGENFTTRGLMEEDISAGDEYQIGSAIVRVTTPRLPCFKLAAKFKRDDIIERFLDSRRSGFYFSVVREGEVAAGDTIKRVARVEPTATIAELNEIYASPVRDIDVLRRAVQVQALPESWRRRFVAMIAELSEETQSV